jgi:hypothetical protein
MKLDRLGKVKTINVLTLAILIAYLIFSAPWLLWAAVFLAVGNAFESRITGAIAVYWMKFAIALGTFNSKVILTLTFYFILTPLAFVYRIFNNDCVNHFRIKKMHSYFEDINKAYTKENFEKVW